MASGTEALLIALMALDLQPGDEVITTPFTFAATAETIVLAGAQAGVRRRRARHLQHRRRAASRPRSAPRTRAIMPVSLYGQVRRHGRDQRHRRAPRAGRSIEDAAQSFGAVYQGRRSCALSHLRRAPASSRASRWAATATAARSSPTTTALAQAAREIRVHGQSARYTHTRVGRRRAHGHAAVRGGAGQARALRVGAASAAPRSARATAAAGRVPGVRAGDACGPTATRVCAQYTVMVDDRAAVQAQLQDAGHPDRRALPACRCTTSRRTRATAAPDCCPVSEPARRAVLSLPMSADLDRGRPGPRRRGAAPVRWRERPAPAGAAASARPRRPEARIGAAAGGASAMRRAVARGTADQPRDAAGLGRPGAGDHRGRGAPGHRAAGRVRAVHQRRGAAAGGDVGFRRRAGAACLAPRRAVARAARRGRRRVRRHRCRRRARAGGVLAPGAAGATRRCGSWRWPRRCCCWRRTSQASGSARGGWRRWPRSRSRRRRWPCWRSRCWRRPARWRCRGFWRPGSAPRPWSASRCCCCWCAPARAGRAGHRRAARRTAVRRDDRGDQPRVAGELPRRAVRRRAHAGAVGHRRLLDRGDGGRTAVVRLGLADAGGLRPHRHARPRARRATTLRALHLSWLALVVAAPLLWLLAAAVLPPALGPDYADSLLPLAVLLPGVLLFGGASAMSAFFTNHAGRPQVPAQIAAGSLALNALLSLLLVPKLGSVGGAGAGLRPSRCCCWPRASRSPPPSR
ncbi:MAG: DegT/DnrJ/EryC1/StrS family aminotransferase [Comamonadaceae bacterium]|nr:DegT/DnrJ/EryC1/StrS family aminotransferase [Comamonadaceae bacterium]